MAENSTIARPYAEAVYRVAAKGDVNAWAQLLESLAQLVGEADVKALIGNPKVTHEQVFTIFEALLKTPLTSDAQNLLRTLIDNRRMLVLPEISEQFQLLKNQHDGSADAHVYSAFPMGDKELAELATRLEKKFKVRLRPVLTVDSNLIGGVRVVVGDEVLDYSVRARLEEMRAALVA